MWIHAKGFDYNINLVPLHLPSIKYQCRFMPRDSTLYINLFQLHLPSIKYQSGFRPGDSTIYQLISITSTVYESFEKYDETRAVFLDISKAFDKVWHEGIIHKLKCNGISGNLLQFFENYLLNRYQMVVLNGTESNWKKIHAGVPQGSVLGPSLFLVYINDLTDNLGSSLENGI